MTGELRWVPLSSRYASNMTVKPDFGTTICMSLQRYAWRSSLHARQLANIHPFRRSRDTLRLGKGECVQRANVVRGPNECPKSPNLRQIRSRTKARGLLHVPTSTI